MRKFLFLLPVIFLIIICKSPPPPPPPDTPLIIKIPEIEEVMEVIEEPVIEVIEPEFSIISIVILQAELINTQFEAVVKIDNPNDFPVDLSSINYELYGNGLFWASGRGKEILYVGANSSGETEFRFSMNFINMKRSLLDDIIAMRQVRYRFAGTAEVEPQISNAEPFNMNFDCQGFSEVKQRTGSR